MAPVFWPECRDGNPGMIGTFLASPKCENVNMNSRKVKYLSGFKRNKIKFMCK
jgi:hypothetical protein